MSWGPGGPANGAPGDWGPLPYAPPGPCAPAVIGSLTEPELAQLAAAGVLRPAHAEPPEPGQTVPRWVRGQLGWLRGPDVARWDWTAATRQLIAGNLTRAGVPDAAGLAAAVPGPALAGVLSGPVEVQVGGHTVTVTVDQDAVPEPEIGGPAGRVPAQYWREVAITVQGPGGQDRDPSAAMLLHPLGKIRRPEVTPAAPPGRVGLAGTPAQVTLSPVAADRLRRYAGPGVDPERFDELTEEVLGHLPEAAAGGYAARSVPLRVDARVDRVRLLATVSAPLGPRWVYVVEASLGAGGPAAAPAPGRPDVEVVVALSPAEAAAAGYPEAPLPRGGGHRAPGARPGADEAGDDWIILDQAPELRDLTGAPFVADPAAPGGPPPNVFGRPLPRAEPLPPPPPENRPRYGSFTAPELAARLTARLGPGLRAVPIGTTGLWVGAAGGAEPGLAEARAAMPLAGHFTLHLGGDVNLPGGPRLDPKQVLAGLPLATPVSVDLGDNGRRISPSTVRRIAGPGSQVVYQVPRGRLSQIPTGDPYAVPVAADHSPAPAQWAAKVIFYPSTGVLVPDPTGPDRALRLDRDQPALPPPVAPLRTLPPVPDGTGAAGGGRPVLSQLPEGWLLDESDRTGVTARPGWLPPLPGRRGTFEVGLPGIVTPPTVAAEVEKLWGSSRDQVQLAHLGERPTEGQLAAHAELAAAIPPGSGLHLAWGGAPGTFVLHRGDPGDHRPPWTPREVTVGLAPDALAGDGGAAVAALLDGLPAARRGGLALVLPAGPALPLPELAARFSPPRDGRPLVVAPRSALAGRAWSDRMVPMVARAGGWVVTFRQTAQYIEIHPADRPPPPVAPHDLQRRPDGRYALPATDWTVTDSVPGVLGIAEPGAEPPAPAASDGPARVEVGRPGGATAPPPAAVAAIAALLHKAAVTPGRPDVDLLVHPGSGDPWMDLGVTGAARDGHQFSPVPGGSRLWAGEAGPVDTDPGGELRLGSPGYTVEVDPSEHSLVALLDHLRGLDRQEHPEVAVVLRPPPAERLDPDRVRRATARIQREVGEHVTVTVRTRDLSGGAPDARPVDSYRRPASVVWATRLVFGSGAAAAPAAPATGVLAEVTATFEDWVGQGRAARQVPKLDPYRAMQLLDEVAALVIGGRELTKTEILSTRESLAPAERVDWVLAIGRLIDSHPAARNPLGSLQRNIVWCADVAPNHQAAA